MFLSIAQCSVDVLLSSVIDLLLPSQASIKLMLALFQNNNAPLETPLWQSYLTNIFVIIIWILFFIALYVSIRYLRHLREEIPALLKVESNVETISRSKKLDPEFIKSELLKEVPADAIIAERVGELHRISRRGGDFEQIALAETLASQESSRTSFARYVANILVLLGLCGAIYGLSNLIRQMGPELRKMQELSRKVSAGQANTSTQNPAQNNSLSSIQESIGTLIETMAGSLEHTKGAFAASLTGIGCSILLLFVNWLVSRQQVAFLVEVETLTSTNLLPLFKPLPPELELSGAVSSFAAGAEYASNVAVKLDDLVGRAVESLQMLFAIVRKFEQGAEAIKESQQSMADAQVRMLMLAEQFTGLTQQIEEHQAGSKESISDFGSAIDATNKYIQQAIADGREKHESLLQQLEKVTSLAVYVTTLVTQEAENAKKETRDLLVTNVTQFGATVSDVLDRQQKSNHDQLVQVLKDHTDNLQKAVGNGQGHKELLEELGKIFANERDGVSNQFKALIESQQKKLSEQFETIVKRQEELVARLEKLSAAIAAPADAAAISDIINHNNLQSLAQQQKETNDLIERVSRYGRHLIDISVTFVCGAGGLVAFASVLGLWHLLVGWPSAGGGQAVVLFVSIIVGAITSYVLYSSLRSEQ